MAISEHFLHMKPSIGKRFVFMLRKGSDFSEDSIEKSWGKESANESGSYNRESEQQQVGSPHGFVIHSIEVLEGNEEVTEVIDVEKWRVDNSRLLRWIVSLFEWNSSVSSMKFSIQSTFRFRLSWSRSAAHKDICAAYFGKVGGKFINDARMCGAQKNLCGVLGAATSDTVFEIPDAVAGRYDVSLGTESRLRPYHFNYLVRSLTMEEMLNKFINEGKREHEEMRAFIYDFQTNNELLFKERNNSLIELRFGVQELLNVINNVPIIDYDVKGVTTRGGKTKTQDVHDNDTNVLPKEHVVVEPEKLIGSNEVLTNDQPQITCEPVVQPSNEQLHINLPFIEALAQMSKYATFLKGLLTNKSRLEEASKIIMNERCSAILLNKLPSKEKDPGSFTIPCGIGQLHIDNALADLGASIRLMPYTMYKKLGLGEPKATRMSLELADRSIQYPRGIIENILIKVDKFVLLIDFVILDMPEDSRVPIILGRPFLATAQAMIDVFNKKITLRVGDDEVIFDVDKSIKRPTTEDDECYRIDDLDETINEEAQELLANEEPDSFLLRGLEKSIDQSDLECCESTITQGTTNGDDVKREHLYSANANEIDEKKPYLKNVPQHLEYTYLHGDKSFPIIISSKLSEREKISLLQVLERRKGAIA
ncbi:DNA-directed DNA polymerase [Tanacetum coccineum]